MKKIALLFALLLLSSFTVMLKVVNSKKNTNLITVESSFTLINDSDGKITIHTGTGIVSLNTGSKTSIGCNVGKEVCRAENGKKRDLIFKITAEMCGKTFKLSEFDK